MKLILYLIVLIQLPTALYGQHVIVQYRETMLMPAALLNSGLPADKLQAMAEGFSNNTLVYQLATDVHCATYSFIKQDVAKPNERALTITPMNFYQQQDKTYQIPALAERRLARPRDAYQLSDWKIEYSTQRKEAGYTLIAATLISDPTITAWFTPDIPINAGPAEYSGLPGLILEVRGNHKSWKAETVQPTTESAADCDELAATIEIATESEWSKYLETNRQLFLYRK